MALNIMNTPKMAASLERTSNMSDEFQIVKHKKGKRYWQKRHNSPSVHASVGSLDDGFLNVDSLKERIRRCREEIMASDFYSGLLDILSKATRDIAESVDANSSKPSQEIEHGEGSNVTRLFSKPDEISTVSNPKTSSLCTKSKSRQHSQEQVTDRDAETCPGQSCIMEKSSDQSEDSHQITRRKTEACNRHSCRSGDCRKSSDTIKKCSDQSEDRPQITERETDACHRHSCTAGGDRNSNDMAAGGQCSVKERTKLSLLVYGLGNFSSCLIARYQLGLLLALRHDSKICVADCETYDPQYTATEKQILQDLGCTVIAHNEEGKRTVQSTTVVLMLHCGKALFNNLLWANWSPWQLQHLIVIGNSFSHILSSIPQRLVEKHVRYISLCQLQKPTQHASLFALRIQPSTSEQPVVNNFIHRDIFNDTSVHWFLPDRIKQAAPGMWSVKEEPVYDPEDLEIILH